MISNKARNYYSDDYKYMIVNLYRSGYTVKEISDKYDISRVSIYRWIKKFDTSNSNSIVEIRSMKREILTLQEENRLLKKALNAILEK